MFLAFSTFEFGKSMMLCHNDTNHCNILQGHFLVLAAYQVQLLTKREIFHAAFYNSNMLKLEWSPFLKYLIKAELLQLKTQSLFA